MHTVTKGNIEDKVFIGTDVTGSPVMSAQSDKTPGVVKDLHRTVCRISAYTGHKDGKPIVTLVRMESEDEP